MKKFLVTFTETIIRTRLVIAESEEQACDYISEHMDELLHVDIDDDMSAEELSDEDFEEYLQDGSVIDLGEEN